MTEECIVAQVDPSISSLPELQNVRVVLVNTTHPGNIGAAARAMKNMGLNALYLVQPRRYPDEEATRRAASAVDVLDGAIVVDTLAEAIADCGLVVGTSARERTIPWPLSEPREFAARAVAEARSHKVAMVFGREDRGLTNEELRQCHLHLHIPTNEDYSSLNLSQAVQIACYECRLAALDRHQAEQGLGSLRDEEADERKWDVEAATVHEMSLFYAHLEAVLSEIEFIKSNNPRQTMTRLQRLFNRAQPDRMEVSILRGVLKSVQALAAGRNK
jgi:tRNA (cytidine32/uridine32-2'-O)-methyltransferase